MRLINLHLVLVALVATTAATFVPVVERGTTFSCEGFCVLVSHSPRSRSVTAIEYADDE